MLRWLPFGLWLTCFTACASTAPLAPAALSLNRAGAEALAQGDLESAGARLGVALEYNPEFVEALTNLALVELARGNFERAEQLLRRSLRLNPDIAQTHHALGVLAERRYRRDLAADHYREALEVDPGFAAARANLGRLLYEAGHFEHALLEFRRLQQLAPELIEGAVGMASTLISLRRYGEARDIADDARARSGDVPSLRLVEARLLLAEGRPAAAVAHLRPLLAEDDAWAVFALAWTSVAELSLGHAERAVHFADRALRLDPEQPLATYALASALRRTGDPSAEAWLERARHLNPTNPKLTSGSERGDAE